MVYKIPLIIWGESPQNEYGGPLNKLNNNILDRSWLEEFGGLLGLRVSDLHSSYGISETDDERGVREEEEAIIQEEIIQMEIQEAIEVENNMAETGYNETNEERAEREARTNVTIIVGDEEVTYTEKEQNDGTIERDQERAKHEELYGIALTDEQIERGDLELYDI